MFLLANIPYEVRVVVDRVLDRWENATPTDFGLLAVVVVVTCWYVSQYTGD